MQKLTYLALPKALKRDDAIKAVKQSIAKWAAIVKGTGADLAGSNCACCKLADRLAREALEAFYGSGPCDYCPIWIDAKVTCSEVGYRDWHYALRKCDGHKLPKKEAGKRRDKALAAAKRLLKYLRRLHRRLHIKKGQQCKSKN